MAFYFILSAIETIALGAYLVSIGSEEKNQLVFNLSLSRLVSSAAVFLAAVMFLYLAILAIRRHSKGIGLFNRYFASKKLVLGFFLLATMVSFSMFVLITRKPGFGSVLKLFLIQLEPIFVWIMLLSAQAAFFAFIWFCAYFIINKEKESIQVTKKELLPVFTLFTFMLVAKWIIVSSTSYGPIGIGDEMTYYDMADSMNRGFFSIAQTHHYPPLYPFTFLPALVFGQHTFALIKLINAAITTSIVFPTYFISRSFLGPRKSLIPALISCLIPYHLVFPRRIVSENLYFPIFLWALFLTFKKPVHKGINFAWDVLTGISLGLLYLTRYISLATIPMFLLAWWIKPFHDGDRIFKPHWKKVLRGLLILAIAIVVFSPWIIGGITEGVPVKLTLGFGITSRTNQDQLTLGKLAIWALLYLFYIILYTAPVLPIMLKSLASIDFRKWESEFERLILQLTVIIAGFLAAATRHSWRAYYNQFFPVHILGRYVLYFIVPFIIITIIALDQKKKKDRPASLFTDLCISAISFGLIFLAHQMIIEGSIFRIGESFLNPLGSVDGYYIEELGNLFYILILALYSFYLLVNSGRIRKHALKVATVLLILFYTTSYADYYRVLVAGQTYPWLSGKIAAKARASINEDDLSGKISLFVPQSLSSRQLAELYNGLRVRGIDNTSIFRSTDDDLLPIQTDYGFIISEYPTDEQADRVMEGRIRFLEKEFTIELVTN